ncbi:MAG TPA: PHB depolymerase family esterase [Candidatus Dormibacteraeota bacterium]
MAILAAVSVPQGVAHAGAVPGTSFSGSYSNAAGTRAYLGYVPSSYHAGTPVPLVVALHGCTQTADGFRQLTQMDSLAASRNFIAVYPEQPSSANYLQCWNWFNSQDQQRGSGEPALIAGITQWVEQHYTVDPRRVYVMGLSAGGAMASVMGATYPDLYAAIGVGSGIEYGATGIQYVAGFGGLDPTQAGTMAYRAMGAHARAMPALIFHGGQDTTVPVINATDLVRQWLTTADLADDGRANDGSIPASPAQTLNQQSPGGVPYTVAKYVDGHGQELLQYWLVPSMAHAWSGGCACQPYASPSGPDETRAMYDFFVNHPMPASGVSTPPATTPPVLPSIPGLPSLPGLPTLTGLPGLPTLPGLTAIPGLPTLPSLSALSGLPALSGLFALPGLSTLLGLLSLPGL